MKNDDLKNNNKMKNKSIQLNPKLKLFLLIFCSWAVQTIFIFLITMWSLVDFDYSDPLTLYISEHFYIIWIIVGCGSFLSFFYWFILQTGIRYLPEDLRGHYVKKNNDQLQKIKNLEITNVTELFNVIPICNEVYLKKQSFDTRTKDTFIGLSWIEETQNRLVVNGKINSEDFSWGVVTKMKKNNLKVFLLAVLYFGPVGGILVGLWPQKVVNADFSKKRKTDGDWNNKLGCLDLFPLKVGKSNSENYLIFSAKLKNRSDLITLISKINNKNQTTNLHSQYEWPPNISEAQKIELQNLIKEMSFLPSIYLYQDQISIVMKKYHYNEQDNQELQTWELIKEQRISNDTQFNYLNKAIKIYHIFNERE